MKCPIRTCMACRTKREKKDLLRVVRTGGGEIVIDRTGKRPGRGGYVCWSEECVALAAKKKAFERALRTAVPARLIDEILEAVRKNENAGR